MADNANNINNEERDDLIELIDENGECTSFEHLATVEYEGDSYLVLADPEAAADEDEDLEVFIMKIEEDEDGNDLYTVPDDDTADAVLNEFTAMLDDIESGDN